MGHETTMNNINASSSLDSTILAVPKLQDDGSNWADYEPRIQNTMGTKGLWRHILGTAIAPVPYAMSNGVPMLADGKTPATEDQIELVMPKVSCAIFICSCYYCLTFVWLQHISLLPSSILLHYPMIFWTFCLSVFHLPFSICTSILHCLLPSSVLCSFVPFLLFSFHHLSIIPFLPFLMMQS